MPFLQSDDYFDPDQFENDVIGIAAELYRGHDSGMHCHDCGQLLYAPRGCMRVSFEDRWFVLTPRQTLFIPPQIMHRVHLSGGVAYRSLYFKQDVLGQFSSVQAFHVSSLLREIIERVAALPFEENLRKDQPLITLLREEITASASRVVDLRMPKDKRIVSILHHYHMADNLPPLTKIADETAMHEKTLSRIFKRDTGLSYQQWVQERRLIYALEYLAAGQSVHQVAQCLAFSSDSAFVSFFKRYTTQTPKQYQSDILNN